MDPLDIQGRLQLFKTTVSVETLSAWTERDRDGMKLRKNDNSVVTSGAGGSV